MQWLAVAVCDSIGGFLLRGKRSLVYAVYSKEWGSPWGYRAEYPIQLVVRTH